MRGAAKGTVSAYAWCRLGDVTAAQFREVAAIQRELGVEVRVTNRQNFVFRGLQEDQLTGLYKRLEAIDMASPGAELARDVVSCPGADTCNLAVTQSRGLAAEIGKALEEAGLAEVGGVRINISGCTNSCGQHHISDIGFVGVERRAHGRSAPGYQLLLGGRVGQSEIEFGRKTMRLPAKAAAEASVRLIGRFAAERTAGERFEQWLDRSGGVPTMAEYLADLDVFPSPDDRPDYYVDYDETGSLQRRGGGGRMSGLLTHQLGELAEISRQFEHASAAEIVQWAHETFGEGLVMAASFQDCVLLDVVAGVAPGIEVVFLDTGFHFAETLLVRRPGSPPVRPQPHGDAPGRRGRRHVAARRRLLLPRPQGGAPGPGPRGQGRVDDRGPTGRGAHPGRHAHRHLRPRPRHGEDQPPGHVDRRGRRELHRRQRPAGAPAHRARLPVDRLLAVHPPGGRWRGSPLRALVGHGQDRVRPPRPAIS